MTLPSIQKFNLAEAVSNSTGKTSMALICAGLIVIVSLGILSYSTIVRYSEGLATGTATLSLGAGLLGIRRFTNDKALYNSTQSTTFEKTVVDATTVTTSNT
jgi:hypothetical protein